MLSFPFVLWMVQPNLHSTGDKGSKWESWGTLAAGGKRVSEGMFKGFYTAGAMVPETRAPRKG